MSVSHNNAPPIKFSRSVLTLLRALAVLSVPDIKELKRAAVKDERNWSLMAADAQGYIMHEPHSDITHSF